MAINERGDVIGFANASAAAGGGFDAHAFLLPRSHGMRDLGTLPGDTFSEALGVNVG
jgi:probable HAF family extracellular repeat protein